MSRIKISPDEKLEIIRLYTVGEQQKNIAKQFQVCPSAINYIIKTYFENLT